MVLIGLLVNWRGTNEIIGGWCVYVCGMKYQESTYFIPIYLPHHNNDNLVKIKKIDEQFSPFYGQEIIYC